VIRLVFSAKASNVTDIINDRGKVTTMEKLLNLVYKHDLSTWSEDAEEAFKELFGGATGRYPERARNAVQIRAR